jgi:hypothetical protein
MIYDNPPKPFYAFDEATEGFHGFDTLDEAVAQAEALAGEYYIPVYVFETKHGFNTDPIEEEPGPDAIVLALIPPAVRDGRRNPTPEELANMPPNWEEICAKYLREHAARLRASTPSR